MRRRTWRLKFLGLFDSGDHRGQLRLHHHSDGFRQREDHNLHSRYRYCEVIDWIEFSG